MYKPCNGVNVMSPPNLYVEIQIPNMMAFGGRIFGRWLDHQGGALMNGISTLIRRDTSDLSGPMWRHWEKTVVCEQGSSPHQLLKLLMIWSCTSQPLELWEIKVYCLSHPVSGIFVNASQTD